MARLGFNVARWFVFCDGRAGIEYDDRGFPAALDSFFFTDLDAALEIARGSGIRLDLVLLDFQWMFSGITHRLADPVTGAMLETRLPEGRADVLLSADGRRALFESVFSPLISRYAPGGERPDLGPAVAAYEFMNEPDFVVEEWEPDLASRVTRPLPFETLAELVSQLSSVVHAVHPGVLTTIGCARHHNLWAWDDEALGLDLLEVHSYPSASVFGLRAGDLGVRKKVLIGEFPARETGKYLEFALDAGYVGAWPWSFSGTDDQGTVPADALLTFAGRYPSLVHPRAEHSVPGPGVQA
jgi:hypothetical protein